MSINQNNTNTGNSPLVISQKLSKLIKNNLIWQTQKVELTDPNKSDRKVSYTTYCYRIPMNLTVIESIIINKKVVYDCKNIGRRTHVLAGGGRFVQRRTIYDKQVVAQSLYLHDIPNYFKKDLVIEIIAQYEN